MTDNTTLPGAGDVVRAIDHGGIKTQVLALDFGGEAGPEQLVSNANPLPINLSATQFVFSTLNSTTSQLGAGATFTGAVESVVNQQDISILLVSDQAMLLVVNQYIDAGGTKLSSSWPYQVQAGIPFSRSFILNGNYYNVVLTNQGFGTSTTLNLNVAFGTIDPTSQSGNISVALQETNVTVPVSVNATNQNSPPLPVSEQGVRDAKTNDSPIFVVDTGDPSGPFAGVNLLEAVIDDNTGLALNVHLTNVKMDSGGALVMSDMKGPFSGPGATAANQILVPPTLTTGYCSAVIYLNGGQGVALVQGSLDGSVWQSVWAYNPVSGVQASSLSFTSAAPGCLVVPCTFPYIRVTALSFSSGVLFGTMYLREAPVSPVGPFIPVIGTASEGSTPANSLPIGGFVRTVPGLNLSNATMSTLSMSRAGQLVIKDYAPVEADWANTHVLATGTSTATMAAGGAGIRNYMTGLQYLNTNTTVGTTVLVLDGATTIWQSFAPPNMTFPAVVNFNTPLHGTAATAMNVQCGTATTNLIISTQGYQST